jgi:DNA-directed RNA polymerase specialized sigma24 family protein
MFAILRIQHSKLLRRMPNAAQPTTPIEEMAIASEVNLEQIERITRVQTAIEQLDDNQKLPRRLVAMEGMTVDEAAESC